MFQQVGRDFFVDGLLVDEVALTLEALERGDREVIRMLVGEPDVVERNIVDVVTVLVKQPPALPEGRARVPGITEHPDLIRLDQDRAVIDEAYPFHGGSSRGLTIHCCGSMTGGRPAGNGLLPDLRLLRPSPGHHFGPTGRRRGTGWPTQGPG